MIRQSQRLQEKTPTAQLESQMLNETFNNVVNLISKPPIYAHINSIFIVLKPHTYTEKIFIKTPKRVAESRSMALFDHNRRGYQRGTRPDQRASKYAPERTTGGTYISHGHFIYFYLIIFLLSIRDCICLSS